MRCTITILNLNLIINRGSSTELNLVGSFVGLNSLSLSLPLSSSSSNHEHSRNDGCC